MSLDSWQDWAVLVTIVTAAIAFYWSRRKDQREAKASANADVKAALDVKDATITGLKEQNDLLREQNENLLKQLDSERVESKRQQERQRAREAKLEARVEELERDYRNLVLTVTTMGFCANASTCPTYNPGDRRTHPDIPEGTD